MNLDKPLASPLSRRRFIASATALMVSPTVFALPGFTRTTSSSGTDARVAAAASVPRQARDDERIRPFTVRVPEAQLVDLRRRIAATKWPSQELVTDASQGVQLATMRELAHTWQTNYDWRKFEAKLNALPQFMTTIDGEDIHFTHVRSKHPNALPVIVTHGWPGSIVEQLKIIEPLTNDHDARSYALISRVFAGQTEGLTRTDILDNVTLYRLTNTAVSSARLYWESKLVFFAPKGSLSPSP